MMATAQESTSRNGDAWSDGVQTRVRRDAEGGSPVLDRLDRQLLDACRSEFPLCEEPFTEIAHRLDGGTDEVLGHLRELERCGVVSRVGPLVAQQHSAAASTQVAMAVPPARLRAIAETVIGNWSVSHPCERQHEFNLWFTLAAPSAGELYDSVADMRERTGVEVLDLRPERHYCGDAASPSLVAWRRTASGRCPEATATRAPLDASDHRLLAVVRGGLSLTSRPYTVVAGRVGLSEAEVIERLKRLLRDGVIEHKGVVEREQAPATGANALMVFDVSGHRVDLVGERLAEVEWVNQCYRCMRRAPIWPYNLYCTLHDDRDLARLIGWMDAEIFGTVRCPRRAVLVGRAHRDAGAANGTAPPQAVLPCLVPTPSA